jgi:hypothetical protein
MEKSPCLQQVSHNKMEKGYGTAKGKILDRGLMAHFASSWRYLGMSVVISSA